MQNMIPFLQQNMIVGASLIVLLGCSALFSGTETALFSLTPDDVRRLRSRRKSFYLIDVLQRYPSNLLSAILFGNLIINILFFCTGAVAAGRWGELYGVWGETLGGMAVLFSVILFGEIVPKAAGVSHPAFILRLTGPLLTVWFRVSRPVHRVIDLLLRLFRLGGEESGAKAEFTADELRELLDAVQHEPGFGEREKMILEDIVNLSDIRVREVMVPRVQFFCKECSTSVDRILGEAADGQFSHVLLYQGRDEDLLGCVSIRELFFARENKQALTDLVRPVLFVPETKRVDQLLKEMIADAWPLSVVVDEYGGLAGMVKLEDLFAEVVGDFESEQDTVCQLDETTYRLAGQLSIRAWKELLTGILPGQDVQALAFDTLGGFVISLLGRMPRPGDRVHLRKLKLTVESMQHRRVQTVLLHLNPPEDPS